MKEEINIIEQALNQGNKSGAYPTLQYAAIAYSALSRVHEYIAELEGKVASQDTAKEIGPKKDK